MIIPALSQDNLSYQDLMHCSKVFGHEKYYRLYLPEGYNSDTARYPVIYFFHGWGGRHFKDDNALLEYTKIKDLVNKYQVILVMWDGNIEDTEPRPYNIGNHKDIKYNVQMKDYFSELVSFIDSSYRTLTDRGHRGIIGFSMGGIMSFFLAGKYPDKICAAVNLAGTPEFFIGYPQNHTLYPVRYTFKNLMEVKTRQHSGDSDILVHLNNEVRKGAEWEGNPYEFWGFKGGHMVDKPGETKVFEMAMKFVVENFGSKTELPDKWSHYDLYDQFSLWGYDVKSNKKTPGFLFLKNVTKQGFGLYSHQWLPDGPPVKEVKADILTAPVYLANHNYNIIIYSMSDDSLKLYKSLSDNAGRIFIPMLNDETETGIYEDSSGPHFVTAGYQLNDGNKYLVPGTQNKLYIKILNKGSELRSSQDLLITLISNDKSIQPKESVHKLAIQLDSRIQILLPFEISCTKTPPPHGEPFQVKFNVLIRLADREFSDEIIVPVLFDAPEFNNIAIDDGRVVKDSAFGMGNGNGIIEAGEHVLLYEGDHRLRLYTNDPWVINQDEKLVDEQLPSIWEDGFTLSSVVAISKDCPKGHVIEFSANYETNTYNPIERNLHWGKVKVFVNNNP